MTDILRYGEPMPGSAPGWPSYGYFASHPTFDDGGYCGELIRQRLFHEEGAPWAKNYFVGVARLGLMLRGFGQPFNLLVASLYQRHGHSCMLFGPITEKEPPHVPT